MKTADVQKMYMEYGKAWFKHEIDTILSFFIDDCVYQDAAFGITNNGKEEFKSFLNQGFTACPDLRLDMKNFFVSGDWVASEWVMSGTHTEEFHSLPATGKKFAVHGATITELEGDKFKRNTDYWNLLDFLKQVGLASEEYIGHKSGG
jgi:steroid delta-isomerase-like uncharacterized protein